MRQTDSPFRGLGGRYKNNKKMKPTIRTFILLAAIVIFSTSCESLLEDSPNADYQIKGYVSDSLSNTALGGIRVILQRPGTVAKFDTVFTDSKGKYDFSFNEYPYDVPVFKLFAKDVDGAEQGGNYLSREITVEITEKDWVDEGDDNWYYGKAQKTVDIKLTTLMQ